MDPDRYAATICEANSRIRHATSRLWVGLLLMIVIMVPAFVFIPISVVSWGFSGMYIAIGAFVFAFVFFFIMVVAAQRVLYYSFFSFLSSLFLSLSLFFSSSVLVVSV